MFLWMADHPSEASLMVAVSGFSPNYTMAGSWVFLSQMLTFLITRGFGMTLFHLLQLQVQNPLTPEKQPEYSHSLPFQGYTPMGMGILKASKPLQIRK